MMPRIAFITSLGHSGSTLLDLMIAAHSRAFSVGEVKSLRRYARLKKDKPKHEYKINRFGNRCACGAETIWCCEFWTKVDEFIQREARITLKELDINATEPAVFQLHNRLLFSAVAAVSNADVIVDSSKSRTRLAGLLRTPGLDVVPIYLTRDPRGQVASVLRAYPPTKWYRAAIGYNWTTIKILKALGLRRRIIVGHSELVRAPVEVLGPAMRALGLSFELSQLDWSTPKHHNLGGNEKVLLATESGLRPDADWQQRLSSSTAFGIRLLTAPAGAVNQLNRSLSIEPAAGEPSIACSRAL